ncbi:uncharacterized protein LOC133825636 [Humulus lupulus]|uniref:uncharacterized protein LOC133825636 n=1 Tax=Humulus lupulus TaxID=3486 RepID=UPI002B413F11|nr:uncharacterized protein LOC133825636 [Humulus lupulus]
MTYSSFPKTRFETTIWAGKLLLLFAGMVSTLTLVKAAVIPFVVDLALSTVPQIWMSFRSWVMSPLYIYIVVNFIIVAIAASSTYQPRNDDNSSSNDNNKKTTDHSIHSQQQKTQSQPTNTTASSSLIEEEKTATIIATELLFPGVPSPEINPGGHSGQNPTVTEDRQEDESDERAVTNSATDRSLFASDPSPETKPGDYFDKNRSRVEMEEEEEDSNSLEETWKAITAGRKLKKSESWDVAPRLVRAEGDENDYGLNKKKNMNGEDDPAVWARREMRKSDTFSDRVSLRREKSMSPEELNKRAEAFIKKVNNDIRLQRLESEQRFFDMVNRGL